MEKLLESKEEEISFVEKCLGIFQHASFTLDKPTKQSQHGPLSNYYISSLCLEFVCRIAELFITTTMEVRKLCGVKCSPVEESKPGRALQISPSEPRYSWILTQD